MNELSESQKMICAICHKKCDFGSVYFFKDSSLKWEIIGQCCE